MRLRDAEVHGGAGEGAQLSSVAPQRGVTPGHSLLLALSMGTMCAQIWPQSAGTVSKETAG